MLTCYQITRMCLQQMRLSSSGAARARRHTCWRAWRTALCSPIAALRCIRCESQGFQTTPLQLTRSGRSGRCSCCCVAPCLMQLPTDPVCLLARPEVVHPHTAQAASGIAFARQALGLAAHCARAEEGPRGAEGGADEEEAAPLLMTRFDAVGAWTPPFLRAC